MNRVAQGMSHRYRRSDTIHGLFASCVSTSPDAIALVHSDRRISYRDLDTLSLGYAAELESLGVGPGDMVPLLMPRGIELVAAMLAILRRGAAYAALDPAWPRTRLRALITELNGPILITGEAWPGPVWDPAHATGARPTPVGVRGSDPAMVFFTSGSTGTPKGVILPHHGTARLFDEDPFQPYGPGIVQAQTMPLHWDGSILDLWSSLLCGGTAILLDEVMQPQVLRRVIGEHGVNAAGFLPGALFNLIVDEDVDAFAGLRFLGIGGERLSSRHVARFIERHPDIALTNVYGPVESTALVTSHPITPADTTADTGIPLGRPVTASTAYVFDGDRRCAPGEIGELCLAGDGLAVAYLNDPELTARHFVTVESGGEPVRVYRTGDLGTVGPDGLFSYHGRADRQVKISGHRIEPGEVERHAEAVPGVLRCAVVPVAGPDGTLRGLRLCYIGAADPEALRGTLADRLPGYLVPAGIRRLDALPLTVNGKVDYAALAEASPQHGGEPVTDDGDPVAAIFRGVLGIDTMSGADSFFDLGGTSLEAARLCARITGALGVTVPVSQIYRTPTVAGLTAWLSEAEATRSESVDGDALIPLGVGPANYIDATDGTICVTTWRVRGPLDEDALAAALNDVHLRHPSLHAHYLRNPPAARIPDRIELVEIHRLAVDGDINQAIQEPLDIARGRIWRAVIGAPDADGSRWFGIGVHHIAFDAWSLDLLVADLSYAYAARLRNEDPQWIAKAPGPAEIARESARLRTVDLDAQRRYWQQHLRTMPRCALPGLPRGPLPPTGPTEGPRLIITEAELAGWDTYGSRFASLLAICGATLREVTGQTDIGVLVPVAMRGNPVADAAVTCRINPVVLRLNMGGSAHEGVPERVNEALAAMDLPFGAVVAAVAQVRPDLHALLTLPIFLLQDRPTSVLRLPGCRVDLIEDRAAQDIPSPLAIEVVLTETGANLNVGVRTDLLPRALADDVAVRYLNILRAGPEASVIKSLQRSDV